MPKARLSIDEIDHRLPKLAKSATRAAHNRALKTGSILIYKDGEILRIEAGGKRIFVKKVEPSTRIKKGSVFTIKADKA